MLYRFFYFFSMMKKVVVLSSSGVLMCSQPLDCTFDFGMLTFCVFLLFGLSLLIRGKLILSLYLL